MSPYEPALPPDLGGLVAVAARAYARRAPLYLGLQALAFALQAAATLLRPTALRLDVWLTGVGTVADAYVVGAIAVGIVGDLAGAPLRSREILDRATARWWAVAGVFAVLQLVVVFTEPLLVDWSPAGLFGLGALAAMALWAALQIATVLAATAPESERWRTVPLAIARGLALAIGIRTILRAVVLGALAALVLLVSVALQDALRARGMSQDLASFWGGVPLDALTVGPLQALFAVLTLDFVRRQPGARR